ncbi:energy-coupling factor transport system ATP-binding protein [Desulfomicrobium macestii]|uniref:Energy-coupling factor transport system ATP-binding protein n=1 Tax=Desulfomicrobium macestii TaxID=90731 RepID=A0ABR9H7H2_9BACT|nr:ABC transporter ATP-binding protein [Desulfomicrobium macestii]MBE1426668.1 energy-coupling factor transport system ATP-binding protein [Desulfomicrobium macestii]
MALTLENVGAAGLTGPLYSGVDLEVGPGECVCITGPTGCGKSTLLRTMAGLHEPGPGRVLLDGQPVSQALPGRIGLILQNPDTQLLCADVGSELAFGLENLRVPPEKITSRMLGAMSRVGLDHDTLPLDRPVGTLSVGQKYKLLLAAMLTMEPHILLLDEPCAQLDQGGIDALNSILENFLAAGGSVVLCEHDPAPLRAIGRILGIANRTLRPAVVPPPVDLPAPPSVPGKTAVVTMENARLELGDKRIWERLDFTLHQGEIAIIKGGNGSGKTSLLRCLTGFESLSDGSASVFGLTPTPKGLRGRVGLLIQNPARQLTADTVLDEVSFPLTYRGLPKARCRELAMDILEKLDLVALAERPPFLLSHGEQHLVALASVLAVEPELLLLDDPFVGLDPASTTRVWSILHQACLDGTSVICTLHRSPAVHGAHSVHELRAMGLIPC